MALDIVLLASNLKTGGVSLQQVSTTPVDTPGAAKLLDAVTFAAGPSRYLALYFEGQAAVPLYEVSSDGTQVTVVKNSEFQIGSNWNLFETFVLGNAPYLLAYQTDKGIFKFFPINPDLTVGIPGRFFRNHEPGITAGFTTVKLFTSQGKVVYMGYNQTTGAVAMYSLDVTATSPPITPVTPAGTPPLLSLNVWSHTWAPGWTRFAFFQFGGANFFLKTNVAKPNVNIDHVMDSLPDGTVEVISQLTLDDAQTLSAVEPFTLGNGDPYFITYRPDGHVTLERFQGSCLGWDRVAEIDAAPDAAQIVPIKTDETQLFALCVPKPNPSSTKVLARKSGRKK